LPHFTLLFLIDLQQLSERVARKSRVRGCRLKNPAQLFPMKRTLCAVGVFACVCFGVARAQVPQVINYQGRIVAGGVNFNGTGQFKFALVDGSGSPAYWTNDNSHLDGSEPGTAVTLTVTKGLYSVLLGDTTLSNMTAIAPAVFNNPDVRLRVWFNDGTHGSQLLTPDQRIAAVGYAVIAAGVPSGAITSPMIANGAVGNPQLGTGSISGTVTCNPTDGSHTFVFIRGTSALAYVGDPVAGAFPFQINMLPPGTYTVVVHTSQGAERSAQVTLSAGQQITNLTLATVDTTSDSNNCGTCGTTCSTPNGTSLCLSGTCSLALCNFGYGNCDGDASNGCEANLNTDPNNCGTCGTVCPNGPNGTAACVAGACSLTCSNGFSNCDGNPSNGCEVNISADTNNCGVCGNTCSTANGTPACIAGACTLAACNSGFADCDGNPANGCETNTTNDVQNCGSCSHVCGIANGTPSCFAGACRVLSCNSGFADCDSNPNNGCETNVATNPNNCGACGRVCSVSHGTPSCTAGACQVAACNTGFADCNLNPNDGCETAISSDFNNCGACNHVCLNGQSCVAGNCQ
jgi:hypothetical protein